MEHAEDGLSALGCETSQDVWSLDQGLLARRAPARAVVVQPVDERVGGVWGLGPGRVRLRAGHERAGEEVGRAAPAERLAWSPVDLDGDLLER